MNLAWWRGLDPDHSPPAPFWRRLKTHDPGLASRPSSEHRWVGKRQVISAPCLVITVIRCDTQTVQPFWALPRLLGRELPRHRLSSEASYAHTIPHLTAPLDTLIQATAPIIFLVRPL